MAAAAREQRELLALMHQQLVQMGYERAAKELLEQSGQKTFPSSHVSLKEILTQWKKTSSQIPKQKSPEKSPVKIRIPDPVSSSESSEQEEAAKTRKANLPVNNSTKLRKTVTKEESSSEDSDSSSEEEAVAKKIVKNPVAGNQAEFLQLADPNINSVPGKGVAVAAVQAKGELSTSASNKPLPLVVTKAGPNKGLSSKARPPSQSLISGGQKPGLTTLAKTAGSAESSSSSTTSESEEGATLTIVKTPPSKPALTKAESTSEDSSDDSDSEEGSKAPAVQLKSPGKSPQPFKALAKHTASSPLNKAVSASTPSKSTQKPHVTTLAKALPPSKEAQSSESSESSSESENETLPVPISQKRFLTPRPSVGTKQNLADQPGILPKTASGALKGKEAQKGGSNSSSSSDSEDETVPTPCKLPTPSAPKASPAVQGVCRVKPQSPEGSRQNAQQSEDSSEDSSDDSDSEEDTAFTQKPAQVSQKPAPVPVKSLAAKHGGASSGTPQPAGKGGATPAKSGAAPLLKASESSETSSSDSSDSKAVEKPAKQAPIHPFFKQMTGKTAMPSGKGAQTILKTPSVASDKCQSPATKATGKERQSSSQKAKPGQGQAPAAKAPGITIHKKSTSDSSSDSEEETGAPTTAKHPAQPATQQKQEAKRASESSSEESSDEDQKASQSLLTGLPSPGKIQATPKVQVSAVAAGPLLSKQISGKASTPTVSAQAKASGKPAAADSTSSTDSSSSSSSEAEETIKPKTEIVSLASSGREAVAAKKGKGAGKRGGLESSSSKPPRAKKAAAKAQSNGQAQRTAAEQLPEALAPLFRAPPGNQEQAAPQVSPGAQEDALASPVAKAKVSKSGMKEKPSKKRKLAVGDAGPEISKGKKLKMQQGGEETLTKKKKKKKSKSSDSIKSSKKKNGKEKKSDKKKKKSKNVEKLNADGSQKKKKKKKKTDNLEEA